MIYNNKKLQNVGINHSADFDYKYFMKTYGKCKKESYYFSTTYATLPPANNSLKFEKIF